MEPNLRFEVQVVIGQAKDGKGVLGTRIHGRVRNRRRMRLVWELHITVCLEQILRRGGVLQDVPNVRDKAMHEYIFFFK